jgi:SAM-dependent methyltransferase
MDVLIGRVRSQSAVPVRTPEQVLEAGRSRSDRYKLGQFFTPEPIARFMAQLIEGPTLHDVLDPAVGGGVLLRALEGSRNRYGIDIDKLAIEAATAGLIDLPGSTTMAVGDFLNREEWPLPIDQFDAIIANPPYIRHHNLSAEHKGWAKRYRQEFNVAVSSLSGSYVYFLLEAIRRLRDGGRLVFITPTEFLDARYGVALKEALLNACEIDEVLVLRQDELAFDGVLTTSAITVATKSDSPQGAVRLTEGVASSSEVVRGASVDLSRERLLPSIPWTPLLPSRARRLLPLMVGRPSGYRHWGQLILLLDAVRGRRTRHRAQVPGAHRDRLARPSPRGSPYHRNVGEGAR